MLKSIWFIFKTEILIHIHRSKTWLYPLCFFFIVMILFPFAFTPDPLFLKKWIPGCIWIAALFSNLLSIDSFLLNDLEDSHLEQLLLSQLPLPFVLLIKLFVQWIISILPIIMMTPVIGLWFHLSFSTIKILGLSLLVGTPCLTLISSLGVVLTLGLRQQGMLLCLLILPLIVPILIFGTSITQQASVNLSTSGPLLFLAGLSLFAATCLPFAMAATLRMSCDD
ncbi:MAG: heme exporter protein CcmB [Gammaproteobacteria bacterium RIFCSPHIGHO2_12_FULL_38_14]|nr:MAG: heme exporter protein CcmB [Gammaproteobacteria bacterium RIFCSPHIGHO2_12_FULL_38_14]